MAKDPAISNVTCHVIADPWKLTQVLIPLLSITFTVIIGNILVITSVFTTRQLRIPTNFYLVSLAFVDLCVGVLILPLNIMTILLNGCWPFDVTSCKAFIIVDIALCTSSILHLCTIAVDRYRSVTGGIQYTHSQKLKHVVVTSAMVNVVSFVISCPSAWWDSTWLEGFDKERNCDPLVTPGFIVYTTMGSFVLPLGVLCTVYLMLFKAIQLRLRTKLERGTISNTTDNSTATDPNLIESCTTQESNDVAKTATLSRKRSLPEMVKSVWASKRKFSLKRERNAARTLGILMGTFIVAWIPYMIMYFSLPFLPEKYRPSFFAFQFLTWMGYCNSAANPIIYTVFNTEFRRAFKRVLRMDEISESLASTFSGMRKKESTISTTMD